MHFLKVEIFQVDVSLMDNIWKSTLDASYCIKLLKAELGAAECSKRSLSDIRIEITENEVIKIHFFESWCFIFIILIKIT